MVPLWQQIVTAGFPLTGTREIAHGMEESMNDKQLRLFISITDQGSFSRAEEIEHTSKQAMLRQINALEEEIGAKLFRRTSGGITLTNAGVGFYQDAKELLKLWDSTVARCRSASPCREYIRIGQVEHQALLHSVTDAFAVRFPDIQIQKVIHPNHSGEYRVEHNIIDVGETFYTAKTSASFTSYIRLADMPYVAALNPGHPLAANSFLSLDKLSCYPTIVFSPMIKEEYLETLKSVFSAHENQLILRRDVDNQVAAAFACSTSHQILLTANCFVRSIPELTVIPLDNGWFQEYGIIYRPNPRPAVQKYVDLAVNIFSKNKNSSTGPP